MGGHERSHARKGNIDSLHEMRYLVTARVKTGRHEALDEAIDNGTLGAGSIAGDEYLHNMAEARALSDGSVKWVETCFCAAPLAEERPYREEYFELVNVKDAHARSKCRQSDDQLAVQVWRCALEASSFIPVNFRLTDY